MDEWEWYTPPGWGGPLLVEKRDVFGKVEVEGMAEPKARILLDRRTGTPVEVQVWHDGAWRPVPDFTTSFEDFFEGE